MPMRPLSRLLLASLTTLALIAGACASQQKTDGSSGSSGGGDGRQAQSTIEDVPNEGGDVAPTGPEFKAYDAPEGFSIGMPAEPQIARKQVPLGSGTVSTAAYSARAMDVLYSVSIADYPEKLVASRPPEALLNEGRDGLAKEVNGTLKDEKDFTLEGGYPGKAYTVSSPTVGELRARNILVGARMYTLLVLFNPNSGAPAADAFFDSLKLVNPPPPLATAVPDAGTVSDAGTLDTGVDAGTTVPDAGTRRRKAK
ncbi:hypothetical protein D7Y13_33205 [Corallococcus praedator]|uniref:Lipoprotein n=2 Tax=Myxococcaceae TaxID=31 RepID=A0ABX9Q8G5_9BACT|nr:hypothetical protein D7X75_35860 [Corallococcus sp. CA031C]RKH94504.1 hypothetical protein D7Y13_33205 [Corallococcus praedator]